MYCKNCGQQIDNNAVVCPHCGVATENYKAQPKTEEQDDRSAGFAVLCFFFPVVGLILWLVWKDNLPLRAKSCGKGAIIGVIVEVAFIILYVVLIFAAASYAATLSIATNILV